MQMAGVMRAIIPLHGILALSTAISCETITHGFPPAHTSRPLGDALEELVAERLVAKISLASSTVQHQGEISHVATDFITLRHHVGPQGNTHIPFARISSIIFENDF